jgi:hypothetical protein
MARAIEMMAQTAMKITVLVARRERQHVELRVWHLGIKSTLRREGYYDGSV